MNKPTLRRERFDKASNHDRKFSKREGMGRAATMGSYVSGVLPGLAAQARHEEALKAEEKAIDKLIVHKSVHRKLQCCLCGYVSHYVMPDTMSCKAEKSCLKRQQEPRYLL